MFEKDQNQHLADFLSPNVLIVHPEDRLDSVMAAFRQQKGGLSWIVLLEYESDVYLGTRFAAIRGWMHSHPEAARSAITMRELADLPNALLQPVACVDEDDIPLEQALEKAAQQPDGFLVATWQGAFCGVFDGRMGRDAASTRTFVSSQPVEDNVETPDESRDQGLDRNPPASGGMKHQPALGKARNFFDKMYGLYSRYRLGMIVTAIVTVLTILTSYILPLATTNFSTVFPNWFPPVMTGEWNVVVSGFVPSGDQSIPSRDARHISQVFFNRFSAELNELGAETGVSVQVLGPEESPVMRGKTAEERENRAAELAKKMKADLVVFGVIQRQGDEYLLTPEFYVNIRNFYETEDVVGQHKLGSAIAILAGGEDSPPQVNLNRELSHRTQVLALVAKGLSLYFTHAYDDALVLFKRANQNDLWQFNTGREVIYLFQGNAAGRSNLLNDAELAYRKALEINPEYSRAYAGLGSVYYLYGLQGLTSENFSPNDDQMRQAISQFDQAIAAGDQPETADIPARVAFGKGQIYLAQAFAGEDTLNSALESFRFVIDAYGDGTNSRIQELASESHARIGLVYRQKDELSNALKEFDLARQLATSPSRRGLHWMTVADLHQKLNHPEEANSAYLKAINEYQSAIPLTSQPETRAEYYGSIATCYERTDQTEKAAQALRDAISYLSAGSQERVEYQARLDGLESP